MPGTIFLRSDIASVLTVGTLDSAAGADKRQARTTR